MIAYEMYIQKRPNEVDIYMYASIGMFCSLL